MRQRVPVNPSANRYKYRDSDKTKGASIMRGPLTLLVLPLTILALVVLLWARGHHGTHHAISLLTGGRPVVAVVFSGDMRTLTACNNSFADLVVRANPDMQFLTFAYLTIQSHRDRKEARRVAQASLPGTHTPARSHTHTHAMNITRSRHDHSEYNTIPRMYVSHAHHR